MKSDFGDTQVAQTEKEKILMKTLIWSLEHWGSGAAVNGDRKTGGICRFG